MLMLMSNNQQYKIIAEATWRAALIWVHSQMVGINPDAGRTLCEAVEKELGI